ncbi:MAG TPA: hypothetical protein VEU30_16950 [Thermoanaerobaculia bacterium]|nr:hypothetical protein [Thermoanaerobaculia bacterium]
MFGVVAVKDVWPLNLPALTRVRHCPAESVTPVIVVGAFENALAGGVRVAVVRL